MNSPKLTACFRFAKTCSRQGGLHTRPRGAVRWPVLMAKPLGLGGCIQVNAPDEAIVIELNINIRQEVIYQLAADVRDNIDENPDIF